MPDRPCTTRIFLITGFLGAGKTTFLKARLAASQVRTGVLVNDFGRINFDGLQIRRDGLQMIELNNGSIFCSCLKDDFINGLVHLLEAGLDEIYIESSGLADPSAFNQILDIVGMRAGRVQFRFGGAICLVDGLFFPKVLPKMMSVERQIRHSHLVVINKCDLIDATALADVRSTLARLNPQARIADTVFGKLDWEALKIELFDIPDEATTNRIETRNQNLVLRLLHEPAAETLREFLMAVAGHFYRIKGYVRCGGQLLQIDLVSQQLNMQPIGPAPDRSAENQLVCLTSRGLESISSLANQANRCLPGIFRLEM